MKARINHWPNPSLSQKVRKAQNFFSTAVESFTARPWAPKAIIKQIAIDADGAINDPSAALSLVS
jgi:hypothetical protein